jgi:hypothetical protein
MANPFENITAQFTAARQGDSMFGRPDYYTNKFAIQDSLDAALIQKEAERIVNDPVLLDQFLKENNIETGRSDTDGGDGQGPGLSIGIGNQTDAITQDAVVAGLLGLFTGGIPGAISKGAKSYITDTLAVLDQVNKSRDPIQALNALQGWTNTSLPAPVVSGKTNYNTPYDSSKDGRINPAPVVSGKDNYNTPYGDNNSSAPGTAAQAGYVGDFM